MTTKNWFVVMLKDHHNRKQKSKCERILQSSKTSNILLKRSLDHLEWGDQYVTMPLPKVLL
jgi:hypothetical protein